MLSVVGLLLPLAGCSHFGFRGVGNEVYVADSVPGLQRAAQKISSARDGTRQADRPREDKPRTLSVSVNENAGFGPEGFRITVSDKEVRIEGGGVGGALYGALEMARATREGRDPATLPYGTVQPRLALRIVRIAEPAPGLSETQVDLDWTVLLDRLADARMNALVVPCDHPFSWLVRLARFPRAFGPASGADPESQQRTASFRRFLQDAQERNIRVILAPGTFRPPASFLREYADRRIDRRADSALCRSYYRECLSQTLKDYPGLAGLGVTAEAISELPTSRRVDFLHTVYLEAVKDLGRETLVLLDPLTGGLLGDVRHGKSVRIVREVHWPRDWKTAAASAGDRTSGRNAPTFCHVLPWRALTPAFPVPATTASILEGLKAEPEDGILLELPEQEKPKARSLERFCFVAEMFGLVAFEPAPDARSVTFIWEEHFGKGAGDFLPAATELASAWVELAGFLRAAPGWSPRTVAEAEGLSYGRVGLRDRDPHLSLVEMIFSRTNDPRCLTVPELVACEVSGRPPSPTRRSPIEVADFMLERSRAALALLAAPERDTRESAEGLQRLRSELEGMAHLAACHGHRIRASVALLRFVAGVADATRNQARGWMEKAVADWKRAADLLDGSGSTGAGIEGDLALIETIQPDPAGFRASPLFEDPSVAEDFDFRCLEGFLYLGGGLLERTPVAYIQEGQLLEAEDFGGNWACRRDVPGYSGEGYATSDLPGRKALFPITSRLHVDKAAICQVWVRALTGGNGDSRAFHVRVGDMDLAPTHLRVDGDLLFSWERAGEASLKEGENFIQILDEGVGREGVDAVVLTPRRDWAPPSY